MTCAADLKPTAAETAAALVFPIDGYSDDDGVDHVTAAVRSVAAAEAQASEWDVAEAEYLRAAEASDDASALEVSATTDDVVEEQGPVHDAYLEARSRLMQTTAPHWAAIGTKADAFLRMWGDDETSRYARAARRLAEVAAKIGKALPDASDLIDVMSARGHAEQLCYYLAHDDDGYRNWAVSLGGVGKIASEAEAIALETRQLARGNDAQLAVSAAVVGAVWFSDKRSEGDDVENLSDQMSTAIREASLRRPSASTTEIERAARGEACIGEIEDRAFVRRPTTQTGLAFQLLVAAGEVEVAQFGTTGEQKEGAAENIRTALSNAIRLMGLPFDYRTAEFYLGKRLCDLDGRRRAGLQQ